MGTLFFMEVNSVNAEEISELVRREIEQWHVKNAARPQDFEYITDEMRKIRAFGDHREDLAAVISDLIVINTEMWHEQDKMRSANDAVVLRAIYNLNPLNQRRNDLVEEIDEIFLERVEDSTAGDRTIISSEEAVQVIQRAIVNWHEESAKRPADYVIATENIRRRRPAGTYRNDMAKIVEELTLNNAEAWHEEDKIHSGNDSAVLAAVRNGNLLNQHRNDLVEELDEMFLSYVENGGRANGNARKFD